MTALVALLVGLLAFVGAMFGHLVSFDLNATSRRREVRRQQIERLAEFLSEDTAFLSSYSKDLLYGKGREAREQPPYRRAYAICILYFSSEFKDKFSALIQARTDYVTAIDSAYMERLRSAVAGNQLLEVTSPTQEAAAAVLDLHNPYYQTILDCLSVASKIAQETIPAQSTVQMIWTTCKTRGKSILAKLSRRKLPHADQ